MDAPLDITLLQDFLAEVSLNNSREWLAAHRDTYDLLRKQWIESLDRVCEAMSVWLPGMSTQNGRSCTYRFFRDTRFSPDKSPLKTYFSAAFSPAGRSDGRAGYYIQVGTAGSPDNGLWAGIYCPDPAQLRKLRKAIIDNIEEFDAIIENPELSALYPDWTGEKLRTAPKGWDRNHPRIDLLRLKDFGRHCRLDTEFFSRPDWPELTAERFHVIAPLVDFLNYSLDE